MPDEPDIFGQRAVHQIHISQTAAEVLLDIRHFTGTLVSGDHRVDHRDRSFAGIAGPVDPAVLSYDSISIRQIWIDALGVL